MSFSVGNKAFPKLAPMKGILRFRKKEKLYSCFTRRFEIF